MSVRECDRCHFLKPDGTRCRLSTCTTGRYCWIHTKKKFGLRVKPSAVGGKGLFAAKVFRPRAAISRYTGEVLTLQQKLARYPEDDAEYVLEVGNRYIDARSTQSSVARYANDCRGTGRPCNAKFRGSTVEATRVIGDGQEVLVPYGRDYWERGDGGGAAKAAAARPPVPVYNVNARKQLLILVGGMNFTSPADAVPTHSDDVRLRMLAHLCSANVKSIGSNPNDSACHIQADVRQLAAPRSSARAATAACDAFILDFYFLPKVYLENNSNQNGYGTKWFTAGGQVAHLLSQRCRAVVLPYDKGGLLWAQYEQHRDELPDGIVVERTADRSLNPLAVATVAAQSDTNWLTLKPNNAVYNRTYTAQSAAYLGRSYKFIIAYRQPGTLQWLRGLCR